MCARETSARTDRHQAAVAVHGDRFDADAETLDAFQEPVEITQHPRSHGSIDDRCRQPLELAEFRQHFAGDADVRVRHRLLHDRLCCLLMRWIAVRMQEADRNRLDIGRLEVRDGVAHRFAIERDQRVAARVDALGTALRNSRATIAGGRVTE
jgi:hypothetical protein